MGKKGDTGQEGKKKGCLGCGSILGVLTLIWLGLIVGGLYSAYQYFISDILVTSPLVFEKSQASDWEVRSLDRKVQSIGKAMALGGHRRVSRSFTGAEITHYIKSYSITATGSPDNELDARVAVTDDYITAAFTLPITMDGLGKGLGTRHVNLVLVGTPEIVDGYPKLTLYEAQLGNAKVPKPFLPRLATEILRQIKTHPDLQNLPVIIDNLSVENGEVYVEFVTVD